MPEPRTRRGGGPRTGKSRIDLVGLGPQDETPKIAVWAVGKDGEEIGRAEVDEKGRFELAPEIAEKARFVYVGPAEDAEELEDRPDRRAVRFKAKRFAARLEGGQALRVPRRLWLRWLLRVRCVNGQVRRCSRWPLLRLNIEAIRKIGPLIPEPPEPFRPLPLPGPEFEPGRAGPIRLAAASSSVSASTFAIAPDRSLADRLTAFPAEPFLPWRCDPICDGVVEVWRRVCCCKPFVLRDPRLPELVARLEDLIPRPPEEIDPPRPWPPRPMPDPIPDPPPTVFARAAIDEGELIKKGALDERALSAREDLAAITSLPPTEVVSYINARPWLFCWWDCSKPRRVAVGHVDEGEFSICWLEPITLLGPNCHEQYAYVVRQHVDGSTVTIYNGLAAGQWFDADDEPTLTSYHPRAQGCRHNEFPGEGAFALLQDIGLVGSHVLHTPPADSWNSVATPTQFNHGLAFPESNPALARGRYLNRNWGGLLRLRCHFSEPMKAVGAKYYRLSVAAANAAGDPTGPRTYLPAEAWRYYEVSGTDILVKKASLGPNSVGGTDDLYEIPYDADRDWQSGQYHALLDTTDFADGRHLLTLEVFNAAGKLIRPSGTADPGGSVQGAFTYRRWENETGPTTPVPFAALTHMLWWDNRRAVGRIIDLRKNGVPNTGECQVLEGVAADRFSVGVRAYHPNPLFLLDHRIWWRRGLGGPSGVLTSPHPNPNNVGVPPAPPGQSGEASFGAMLGPHARCSFSVNLHVNVKTFNGVGTLDGNDAWDQAAFALDIG